MSFVDFALVRDARNGSAASRPGAKSEPDGSAASRPGAKSELNGSAASRPGAKSEPA